MEALAEEYIRANEKPIDHAAYLSTEALSKRFWNVDLRRACLEKLTYQEFTKFVANLFSKVSSVLAYIQLFTEFTKFAPYLFNKFAHEFVVQEFSKSLPIISNRVSNVLTFLQLVKSLRSS